MTPKNDRHGRMATPLLLTIPVICLASLLDDQTLAVPAIVLITLVGGIYCWTGRMAG